MNARSMSLLAALTLVAWGWNAFAQSGNVPSVQAVSALKEQAASGDAVSQYRLGSLYSNGSGVPQDYGEAKYWWRESAAQGDVNAESSLGWLYLNGWGTKMDDTKAAMWFRKAAEQGDAESEYALGVCYDRGEGVREDHNQAAYWYRKAAKQGIAEAQGNLGAMQDEERAEENSIIAASLSGLAILCAITGGIYDAFRRSGAKLAKGLKTTLPDLFRRL